MGRFGETAENYETRRGDEDDVWIKGFRGGETTIRILQPTADWITYREHYDRRIKAFLPCSEDSECKACASSDEQDQKRTRKYATNTLDSEGRHGVHKFGSRMFRTLKGREERTGSLLNRDHTIIKTGSGMDTVYDIEAGDKYDIDVDFPFIDVVELLEEAHARAEALYAGAGADEEDPEAEAEATPTTRERISAPSAKAAPAKKAAAKRITPAGQAEAEPRAAAKKVAAKKTVAKKTVAKEPEPETEAEPEAVAEDGGEGTINFEDMSTTEIKAWLTENNVDYPDNAPRSRIIALAEGFEY